MTIKFNVNGKSVSTEADGNTPLLWVLRDELGLTGTKYGCGVEICGACMVLVDGESEKSCDMEVKEARGRHITTIEGIDTTARGRKIQQAWIDHQVPQCGYCQSGMIIAVYNLLRAHAHPTDAQIDSALRNICVCGTYQRVRQAIHAIVAG